MKYAGFWQRFAAGTIDVFVLLLPLFVFGWLSSRSKTIAMIVILPYGLLCWLYTLYFHAASGQTIGKRALHIRVVHLDGSRIGWPESFKRSAVDLCFGIIWIVGDLWAVNSLSAEHYSAAEWSEQQNLLLAARPVFAQWADIASQVWVWSEVFTMLFNRRKRAIHDFIAGTVVIDEVASQQIVR
jgi:uncharacterized RDD family membrane protein YckC